MRSRLRAMLSAATLGFVVRSLGGCVDVLETIVLRSRDGATETGASDASERDAPDGTLHDVTSDALRSDATDDSSLDGGPHDAGSMDGQSFDGFVDAGPPDITTSSDAITPIDGDIRLDAGPPVHLGPAGGSCATTDFYPNADFSGTTCGGTDAIPLTCRAGAYPEVVIRIDGRAGDRFRVTLSAGLWYGVYLGSMCSTMSASSCGGPTLDAGDITLGPYPTNRTDYIVVESASLAGCGAYSVAIRQL